VSIDRLGRALMAQLSPLTGARAVGSARVVATGGSVILPPNTYAIPVVDGAAHEELLVKVAFNPATESEHKLGGEWLVDPSAEPDGTLVDFVANTGGAIYNFPAGSRLVFSPPVAGLEPSADVAAAFVGGVEGQVKQVVVFDDIQTAAEEIALFQAKVRAVPALVLAWMQSAPVEGRSSGLSQGGSRKGRGVRAYFETWALYVIAADSTGEEARRRGALDIMEAARALLTDRKRSDDGELLSAMGTGIDILSSVRLKPRRESAARFLTTFRTVAMLEATDGRTFVPWELTRIESFVEASADNPEPLVVHAPEVEMQDE